jgi:hypothetical protein
MNLPDDDYDDYRRDFRHSYLLIATAASTPTYRDSFHVYFKKYSSNFNTTMRNTNRTRTREGR